MRWLAIVLSLSVLDGCVASVALRATSAALRGEGDTANLQGCPDEDPCLDGDGGTAAAVLAYGVGVAALGVGVGALVHEIARARAADPRPRS